MTGWAVLFGYLGLGLPKLVCSFEPQTELHNVQTLWQRDGAHQFGHNSVQSLTQVSGLELICILLTENRQLELAATHRDLPPRR